MNVSLKQYCKKYKINKNNYDSILFLKWHLDQIEKFENYFSIKLKIENDHIIQSNQKIAKILFK